MTRDAAAIVPLLRAKPSAGGERDGARWAWGGNGVGPSEAEERGGEIRRRRDSARKKQDRHAASGPGFGKED